MDVHQNITSGYLWVIALDVRFTFLDLLIHILQIFFK